MTAYQSEHMAQITREHFEAIIKRSGAFEGQAPVLTRRNTQGRPITTRRGPNVCELRVVGSRVDDAPLAWSNAGIQKMLKSSLNTLKSSPVRAPPWDKFRH